MCFATRWTESQNNNQRSVRFNCSRGKGSYKKISKFLLTLDLDSSRPLEILNESNDSKFSWTLNFCLYEIVISKFRCLDSWKNQNCDLKMSKILISWKFYPSIHKILVLKLMLEIRSVIGHWSQDISGLTGTAIYWAYVWKPVLGLHKSKLLKKPNE